MPEGNVAELFSLQRGKENKNSVLRQNLDKISSLRRKEISVNISVQMSLGCGLFVPLNNHC